MQLHCYSSWLLLLLGLTSGSTDGEGFDNLSSISTVTCNTTKGEIEMILYQVYSPNGYDRAVELFEKGFYDNSHFFRVVPRFLVQFGISYTDDEDLKRFSKTPIEDDPVIKAIPFEPGTISFAGSGPNSRTSHLFISLMKSPQFGANPWETPIGRVSRGMDVVLQLESGYGDMPPWGKGPEQAPIYEGPQYIQENFPLLDKFLTCQVNTVYIRQSNIPPTSQPDDSGDSGSEDYDSNSNSNSDSDSEDEGEDEDEDEDNEL